MDDLLSEFLTETNESLESLDTELVNLERNPNDPELLGNIFRLVHTIKGTCGFLGLPRLESVAHSAENVLGNFREGIQVVTPDAVSLILEALDRIKDLMASLEASEQEPDGDDSELIGRLDQMYRSAKNGTSPAGAQSVGEAATEEAPAQTPVTNGAAPATNQSAYERLGGTSTIDTAIELLYRKVEKDETLAPLFEGVQMARLSGRQVEYVVMALSGPDEFEPEDLHNIYQQLIANGAGDAHFDALLAQLGLAFSELGIDISLVEEVLAAVGPSRIGLLGAVEAPPAADPAEIAPAATEAEPSEAVVEEVQQSEPVPQPEAEPKEAAAKESSVANQSIRVNVVLLEDLMNMVSELVLTRNQLLQMVRKFEDTEFKVPLQRLSHVTTDLQEGVMKTRMQPIGNAWAKLPRIVRDISHELDKKIELEMLGADTELDRQILDMIKDPLTHMVRNSGDHGLETPAERAAAGKAEIGSIILNAYHEGGHIIIEISDDGKGIDVRKVKQKAVSNGLATQAELETMPDQQIMQFIFKAGFSTAEKVTSVSGRGVGMDVVRTNIEKIGGTIELKSALGKGSKFTIKIPLTLAIVSALIVECAGERFAIPQLSVVELVRVSSGSDHRIERIKDTPVLRLRNRLLPLISLVDLLQLNGIGRPPVLERIASQPATPSVEPVEELTEGLDYGPETGEVIPISAGKKRKSDEIFIVVAQVANYNFGIIVDSVHDTEEIVVKPVAPILRDIPIYSGNTILGDGSVIMILDPNGIATATGEISISDQAAARTDADADADSARSEKSAILLFRAEGDEPKAVPLSLVARLEEINPSEIEISDGVPVVQYRGQLMPLLGLESKFSVNEEGRQPVIVFAEGNKSMGLVVDEIVDIVEDNLNVEIASETEGVLGSAVIAGKATDVIDASYYLTQAFGDWFTPPGDSPAAAQGGGRRILLVDDSAFFRNLLTPLLTIAGYHVTCAESADAALGLREAGESFDAIISDIEMPGMDGFEFAAEIRGSGTWRDLPLVALSSHTTQKDIERGREVGFSDYVAKLDRDALLQSLAQTVTALRGAA